jgi:hypothetical protein
MKKIFLGFGILSIVGVANAAVPTVGDFPFERDVQLPSLSDKQEVQVDLDRDVLQAVNERFGNIALFDKQNTPFEYSVFFQDFHRLNSIDVKEVSSQKGDMTMSAISDDDVLTTFVFDERADGRDASWVLLDLGEDVPLSRVEVFTPDGAIIRSIAIEGGMTADSLKTIVSKRTMQQRFELTTDSLRFLKISFWGVQIKIDDIRVTAGATGSLYFSTLPGKDIRLLYGGDGDRILYSQRISDKKVALPLARLGRETINTQFPVDKDGDGVNIEEDNCPLVANHSQKDSDDDRVGDACDNAVETLNSRQEDTDRDGVGDIIDNCKLVVNPDQADRDNDGWGDACDNAHETEPMVIALWIKMIGAGAIILLLLFGLWQVRRTKKLKK